MLRRLGLVFAALALLLIAGGPWAVLQTVAWVEMLHDYTQRTGSFTLAAAQTFDGQHPCDLCREIATAKAREHQKPSTAPGAKDDQAKVKATVAKAALPPPAPVVILLARIPGGPPMGPGRTEPPPTPPPRRAALAA